MIGSVSVFQPTVRKGFRRDMWHPISDSGGGENRWSVSEGGQQILAEQIMEAVIENVFKRDPQGLPMIQSCETLLKVKVWEYPECNPHSGLDGILWFYSAFIQCCECICFYQRLKDKLGKSSSHFN